MVSRELRHAARITRKTDIPPSVRTSKKDEAADWIDEHAADNWQEWTFTEIAEETGFSRQHIANTAADYYTPVTATAAGSGGPEVTKVEGIGIEEGDVPEWILEKVKEAYREGVRDGIEIGESLS